MSTADAPEVRNERQRRITQARAQAFEAALAELAADPPDVDPRLVEALADGYREAARRLTAKLDEYDALRRGDRQSVPLREVASLGDALVAGRIARNWTQADLAEALGIPPQQVQRYEATGYRRASLRRVGDVASVLGIRLDGAAVLAAHGTEAPEHLSQP
jgi:HTH-type transcriptional regulator/antitoxin HigA